MVYKYFNIVFNKMNRKYLINFIILMVTILLFLLVFEFSLRIFSPQPVLIRSHIEASPTIFQEEEDIPWGLKPLVNTRHIGIFDEWNVSIKTPTMIIINPTQVIEFNLSWKDCPAKKIPTPMDIKAIERF